VGTVVPIRRRFSVQGEGSRHKRAWPRRIFQAPVWRSLIKGPACANFCSSGDGGGNCAAEHIDIDGLDDRFIVALAGGETSYGTNPLWNSASAGIYNVFSNS
jgi:hypothetical protein